MKFLCFFAMCQRSRDISRASTEENWEWRDKLQLLLIKLYHIALKKEKGQPEFQQVVDHNLWSNEIPPPSAQQKKNFSIDLFYFIIRPERGVFF